MNTKKTVVLLCVIWMASVTFGYTLIGPPTAELRVNPDVCHEANVGYIFSFSKMDTDDDFELTRHYFTWGIALDESFDFNLLLGAVSGEADIDEPGVSDFDGDHGFSYGFNVKSTFLDYETIDWGITYQMTWFSTEDKVDGYNLDIDDAYDIQVAVGPTVDMGRWKLYGGVFYYMLDGDLDISPPYMGIDNADVDEEDEFAAFIGAQFKIREKTDLTVEYLRGNDSYGLAAAIGLRF